MASQREISDKKDLIIGLEQNLAIEQAKGLNTRSTEEELRRQRQELINLQR